MQLAIISDIHGNCFAFDRVLADMRQQGIERVVCLGDAIQGGAQPAETVARLRELGCPVVMGNADVWLVTGLETSPHKQASEQQLATRTWSLAQLSAEDRAFIQQFQPTIEIGLEAGRKLLCFHGSPRSFDDLILPDTSEDALSQLLSGFDATLLTGGHTHTQQLRRLRNAWYFNPGSVGFAYNWQLSGEQFQADPWAEYAVVTSEGESSGTTFRHVPFDVDELARITEITPAHRKRCKSSIIICWALRPFSSGVATSQVFHRRRVIVLQVTSFPPRCGEGGDTRVMRQKHSRSGLLSRAFPKPMLAGIAQGHGFPNLSCLGLLADRILVS